MIIIPRAARFPAARPRIESPASYQTAVSNARAMALNEKGIDLAMRMATELVAVVVAVKWKLKEG